MTTFLCETTTQDDGKIDKYSYSKKIFPGNTWKIDVTVLSVSWLIADDFTLNVVDKDTDQVLATNSFHLDPNASKTISFTGIMPDRDLHINLSLLDNNFMDTHCEDYKEFTIQTAKTETEEQEKPSEDNNYLTYIFIVIVIILVIITIFFGMRLL